MQILVKGDESFENLWLDSQPFEHNFFKTA